MTETHPVTTRDTNNREALLETYGSFYGSERFAVAFTASLHGEDAKRVTVAGWDKTQPLANAQFGAGVVGKRGLNRNVAIVLRPSNLIVLECDTEQDLVRIEELKLPATITVRSSKPYKRHYWYRPPESLTTLPYVAFRFESGKLTADSGRYFLAPPSVHPSGAIYSFIPDHGPGEMDIAELPEHVYRELGEQARAETEEQSRLIHIDPGAKVIAGQRGDRIFRYASMLRRWGLTRDQILAACLQWNNDRCEPPIEHARVEIQVDGAMKKDGDQEIAHALAHPLPDQPETNPTPQPEDEEEDSWAPVNLATLEEKPPVKPTLGGVGIAYPGKRHIFSGPQESAKTLAAYAIGLELVRERQRIVLIDFEMGRWDARDRLRELGATAEDFALVDYVEPGDPATPERISRLVDRQPVLVIIDAAAGAYDIQGLDDNKRQDVERFTRLYVRDFWRSGIATIVLDHVVKNSETRGKYAIGSERKVGGADVHLGFEVIVPIKRGAEGRYKISTHKDRGGFLTRGRLADMVLSSHPETHAITWQFTTAEHPEGDNVWRPTVLMQRASEYLEKQLEPVSFNQVITNTKGNETTLKDALEHLISLGFAREESGPRGARNVVSERPYRQPPPTSASPPPAEVNPDLRPPPLGGAGRRTTGQAEDTTSAYPNDPERQYLIDLYGNPSNPPEGTTA